MSIKQEEFAHVLRAILDTLDREPPVKAIGAIEWLEDEANRLVRESGLLGHVQDRIPPEFRERAIFHRHEIPGEEDLPPDVRQLAQRARNGESLSLEDQARVLSFAPEVLVYSVYGPSGVCGTSRLAWFSASTTFDDDSPTGWRQPLPLGVGMPDEELVDRVRRCIQDWLYLAERPLPDGDRDYLMTRLWGWVQSHRFISVVVAAGIVIAAVVTWATQVMDFIERVLQLLRSSG